MEQLKTKLRTLRWKAAATSLEQRNQQALTERSTYLDFLELLTEDELAERGAAAYRNRLKASRLTENKTLDSFEFSYQPELDRRLIYELGSCQFLALHQNIVLIGKPGVGKTHLANAIGLEAVKQGRNALFLHAGDLIEKLHTSRADGGYYKLLARLGKADLLIIDEIGFKKIPAGGMDDFFEVIRRRYEHGSLIVTTNRNFEDWGPLFGDNVMASAIIDRIVHNGIILKITGSSYRIKAQQRIKDENQGQAPVAKKSVRPGAGAPAPGRTEPAKQ